MKIKPTTHITHMRSSKVLGVRKGRVSKSRTDQKVIRRQFLCSKEGRKSRDKCYDRQDVAFPRDTRCHCGARMEFVINDTAEWSVAKFIAEHNLPLSTTPSKSRLHRSHSTGHRMNTARRLVCSLNSEGIGPPNIVRVCNTVVGLPEQHITARQRDHIVRRERRNNMGKECMEIVRYFQRRQQENGTFYFAPDLGDDGMLHSVFWADG